MVRFSAVLGVIGLGLGVATIGCESTGVGDPCIPEDEYLKSFSGFSAEEVNVESRSFQCETRLCLINHFQGRVSCPYGQASSTSGNGCFVPGASGPENRVQVAVEAQLAQRQADKAVYCSCRCDGPDPNARYCECPSGFTCTKLIDDLKLGSGQLAGSYCVKDGTEYNKSQTPTVPCNESQRNCGNDGKNPGN